MADIERTVRIARAPEDVRAFVLDPAAQTRWQANLVEFVKTTPGPSGLGTRQRGAVAIAGRRLVWRAEIVQWDEHGYTVRSVDSQPSFSVRWTFTAAGGGTEVTYEQSSPALRGIAGALTRQVVGRMADRDLATLRALLEGG